MEILAASVPSCKCNNKLLECETIQILMKRNSKFMHTCSAAIFVDLRGQKVEEAPHFGLFTHFWLLCILRPETGFPIYLQRWGCFKRITERADFWYVITTLMRITSVKIDPILTYQCKFLTKWIGWELCFFVLFPSNLGDLAAMKIL